MLEGINYLNAKFQINILKNKKVIKLKELVTTLNKKRKKNSAIKSALTYIHQTQTKRMFGWVVNFFPFKIVNGTCKSVSYYKKSTIIFKFS